MHVIYSCCTRIALISITWTNMEGSGRSRGTTVTKTDDNAIYHEVSPTIVSIAVNRGWTGRGGGRQSSYCINSLLKSKYLFKRQNYPYRIQQSPSSNVLGEIVKDFLRKNFYCSWVRRWNCLAPNQRKRRLGCFEDRHRFNVIFYL